MLRRLMLLFVFTPLAARCQQMAITFDDLPAAGQKPANLSRLEIAQSILFTLKKQEMPPVYGFVNGVRTEEDPTTFSVLDAWRAAGQPLGSHTWSHPNLEDITAAEFEADITKNEPLLRKYMAGEDWHWFRYPYLHEGETTAKHREVRTWLKAHNYKVAEVTMDFEDYLWNEPYARCVDKGDTEAIAQLHDSFLSTAAAYIDTYRTWHATSTAMTYTTFYFCTRELSRRASSPSSSISIASAALPSSAAHCRGRSRFTQKTLTLAIQAAAL